MTKNRSTIIFALASCLAFIFNSCNEVIPINHEDTNETVAPQTPDYVITFAISSGKATRASNIVSIDKYIGTFAVWATKIANNGTSNSPMEIFNGDDIDRIVTYDENKMQPNHWTYSQYRYWDKQASYAFAAVSPNANIIRYNKPENVADNSGKYVTTNASGYTLVGQNLQSSAIPAEDEIMLGFKGSQGQDTDLMISDKVNINGAYGAEGDVYLEFKHILSKLNIAIRKDPTFDNVKVLIKSVKITGLDDTGTYNMSSSYGASGWTSSSTNADYALLWKNDNGIELLSENRCLYFIESLVMPQSIEENAEKLTVDYAIVSGSYQENYHYELNLNDGSYRVFDSFMDGNKYIIYLTIRPNVITFDAQTMDWALTTQNYVVVY